jgi:dihydrofolate reductase
MRKLIVSEFVTLDGVMEGPGPVDPFPRAGWSMAYGGPEIGKIKFDELFASDALLLGRVTYEGFAAAWPSMKDEAGFADRMNGIAKYVVSTTLNEAAWNNTHIIRERPIEAIQALKEQQGQDILVGGSGALVQTLMRHNLVDEYRLLVYPVVLGTGKRLFKDGADATLKLVEARALPAGVALLRYEPAE